MRFAHFFAKNPVSGALNFLKFFKKVQVQKLNFCTKKVQMEGFLAKKKFRTPGPKKPDWRRLLGFLAGVFRVFWDHQAMAQPFWPKKGQKVAP